MNIAEILKDCPEGTKLYSPLCGECTLKGFEKRTCDTPLRIIVITTKDTEIWFNQFGKYFNDFITDECLLFPSKDNRDWGKFQRPFKDGDIVVDSLGGIHIMQNSSTSYCYFDRLGILVKSKTTCVRVDRFATEEEKQKLFDAIKANGYKWNEETKTLEKLIV